MTFSFFACLYFFFLPPFSPLNELFFLHISSLPLVYCCDTFALSVFYFLSQDILDLGLKWVLIAKVNGWILCQDFRVMCCDFLFLDIHAMLIYIIFVCVSSGKVDGEGLYKWRFFCESYTILAFLSFKNTSNSGEPFSFFVVLLLIDCCWSSCCYLLGNISTLLSLLPTDQTTKSLSALNIDFLLLSASTC